MRGKNRSVKDRNGYSLQETAEPNWMDGDTYPQPESLNDTFWRWEFLRRRADYRQDWE
jgi:hypothetical protein